MQAEIISNGGWRDAADAACVTVNRIPGTREPTSEWKTKMLLAEHSPIRLVKVRAILKGIPSWVSTHLVRHKIGIEHFVRTQRSDRTRVQRDELSQGALVDHMFEANAQSIITISRKRLCGCASKETSRVWHSFIEALGDWERELASACVPECLYRGFCPESFNDTCLYCQYVDWQECRGAYVNFNKPLDTGK